MTTNENINNAAILDDEPAPDPGEPVQDPCDPKAKCSEDPPADPPVISARTGGKLPRQKFSVRSRTEPIARFTCDAIDEADAIRQYVIHHKIAAPAKHSFIALRVPA